MWLKVQDDNSLIRDDSTNAIVNSNKAAYEAALLRRRALIDSKDKQMALEDDINNLKQEVTEIKDLLYRIVDRIG